MPAAVITRRLLLDFSDLLLHIVINPRVDLGACLFLDRDFWWEYLIKAICWEDSFGLPHRSRKLERLILDDPFLKVVDALL